MARNSFRLLTAVLGPTLLAASLAGCSRGPVAVEAATVLTDTNTDATPAEAEPAELSPNASSPDLAVAELVATQPPAEAYEPPFPLRETLFDPPKQAAVAAGPGQTQQSGSVQLLGFANLGSQRAVLSIDGVIAPLESGGEHAGVKVISVSPPKVVLQRGRNRWTESIQ
ncbi:hypothetical protein [Botrimarina hoheduenensis]|uniref:Pilus assembly protein PilP n=1 Tax=Botrimarina hoheduenensis TaxID=2528000 RepID=A0A5C5WFK0_9BACT|nr:hypothetical protein [Botrimarina hoheduenensis]TWT48865.1 hypothetical protein Pla111_06410 [Botrimarina hoheduenensis]